MKDIILITKQIKLNLTERNMSVHELDMNDIISQYSNDYTIDLEKYSSTILNDYLVVTFLLVKKKK